MSKFKLRLKLTGLELEVEGSREDMPNIARQLNAQFGSLVTPAAGIVEGRTPQLSRDPIDVTPQAPSGTRARTGRRSSARAANGASDAAAAAIVWQHDANVWGNPLLAWKAVDKAVWLLYVAKQVGAVSEMTVGQMVVTFDKLFRTAGKLNKGNIARDFAKLNSEPPPKVQMNGTADPATWYLTDAGIKHAENLVKAARGEPAAKE